MLPALLMTALRRAVAALDRYAEAAFEVGEDTKTLLTLGCMIVLPVACALLAATDNSYAARRSAPADVDPPSVRHPRSMAATGGAPGKATPGGAVPKSKFRFSRGEPGSVTARRSWDRQRATKLAKLDAAQREGQANDGG